MAIKSPAKKGEEEHVLDDLMVIQLRGLYDVEAQVVKAMPRFAKKAADAGLKEQCGQMQAEAEKRTKLLEGIFVKLEIKPQKLPSAAIRGLMEDADWIVKNIVGGVAIDAGLLAALQGVQRYLLAMYSTALSWAKMLEFRETAEILQGIVHDADERSSALDELAASRVDEAAIGEDEDEEKTNDENEDDEDADEENGEDGPEEDDDD